MTLVTRGVCRVDTEAAPDVDCTNFELWGNAWTFEKGNTVLLELSQADAPMFRLNNTLSTIAYTEAALALPSVRGLIVGRALLYPPGDDVTKAVDTAVSLVH